MSLSIVLLLTIFALPTKETSLQDITVYYFMGEQCIISQNFTDEMRRLHAEFTPQGVEFIGMFPNGYSTKKGLSDFKEKYAIPFELILDDKQVMMQKFGVKISPEVVVFDSRKKEVLYHGRINNRYVRVGRRRPQATTTDLQDALQAIQENQPIAVKKTQAIGCFITQMSQCTTN